MRSDSSVLLIDNSNSRTKFCLYQSGSIRSDMKIISTGDISDVTLRCCLANWHYSAVYVCSVVPEKAKILEAFFSCPVYFLRYDSCDLVDFASYPGKCTLGADRVANVLGLSEWNRFPAVAVDLGTAVTLEVVVKNSSGRLQFIGGMIAPGLSLFSEYLSTRTAQLPQVQHLMQPPVDYIGRDTARSIHAGFFSGAVGMLRSMLGAVTASLRETPFIVATGGDAAWAAAQLPEIDEVDTLLTLRGLARYAESES
ncbi:MAG: type III pantothenate kinase [Akkermansia sp.]|nr:type III pantothenate kinase [Akkermansia sp.]